MTENKQFHLKIIWKNREKTEAHEIVLYDGGQPLCELISVDDARLVRDIMNEQEERIETLKRTMKGVAELDKLKEYIRKNDEEIYRISNGDD